jgi:hypothetical protein
MRTWWARLAAPAAENLVRDFLCAVRMAGRSPGFTAAVDAMRALRCE